ncbi:hypothetical protein EDD33_1813 [Nocardioides aurantiacus]|uniref:Uncharacterized protein n=1 Tax=Nocardioides aurantiacus TaxID=86796 RepID=A0A3N2CU21_9ACTN|nr:hypothetical protein EDD33_1813 [Nocardioides aurantiacus]
MGHRASDANSFQSKFEISDVAAREASISRTRYGAPAVLNYV